MGHIVILHEVFTCRSVVRAKRQSDYGRFVLPGGFPPGGGRKGLKYGISLKIREIWQKNGRSGNPSSVILRSVIEYGLPFFTRVRIRATAFVLGAAAANSVCAMGLQSSLERRNATDILQFINRRIRPVNNPAQISRITVSRPRAYQAPVCGIRRSCWIHPLVETWRACIASAAASTERRDLSVVDMGVRT